MNTTSVVIVGAGFYAAATDGKMPLMTGFFDRLTKEQCRPFEPCQCEYCGTDCGPVMVLPTMGKHLDEIPEIGVMWEACRSAIKQAESILLFGFSMPPSDELLMQLIRSASRDGGNLRRIASIDLDPAAVIDRLESCLPIDASVEAIYFPVEIGRKPLWLASGCADAAHARIISKKAYRC